LVLGLLPWWVREPTVQQLNMRNSAGANVTFRTEDDRSFDMPPRGDSGFPETAFLTRPGESVTFEAKVDGKVVTRSVTPIPTGVVSGGRESD
jgi:hypothetical protein